MERLIQHLQLTAEQADVAELHQWLMEYLVPMQAGVNPTLELRPHVTGQPVLHSLRWSGTHLRISDRLVKEIPPRLVALLALRNYLEATARRRLNLISVVLTVLIVIIGGPMLFRLGERFPFRYSGWLFELLLAIPIELVWRWRDRIARSTDRQTVEFSRDGDLFVQAMESALRFDLKDNVPSTFARELLGRLNLVRKQLGYPELTLEEVLPPPQTENDGEHAPEMSDPEEGEPLRRVEF